MNLSEPKLELYKNRDMGQMMGFAATLVRRHWKHMFRTIGMMSLPLMLMSSTLYFLGTSANLAQFDMALGRVPTNPFNSNLLLACLSIYVTYITILWGTVYYVQLYDEKGPENFTWNDIWAKVFSHGWWLLLSNLLIFLVAGLATLVSFLFVFTIILIPLVFVCWLGIFAFIQLWTIVYLFEAKNLYDALMRSFVLVKKQWLKGIALFICCYMIVYGFIMLPAMAGMVFTFVQGNMGVESMFLDENLWLILLIQNLASILGFLSTFFISLSFTSFYLTNVERLEKVSLKARIAKLSENSPLSSYS